MILELETEIFGNFFIDNAFEIKHHPFSIRMWFDDIANEYKLTICKRVNNYSNYIPKLKNGDSKFKNIEFPNENFLEEERTILQHIESFGALDCGVKKINWDNFKIKWIPENEIEMKDLCINEYRRNQTYKIQKSKLTQKWLSDTIIHRSQLSKLYLPFSFYRYGINLYNNYQYQNAFLHFYLMLEGFFGNGQFSKRKIKIEFSKSDILDYAIGETLSYLFKKNNNHYNWLKNIIKTYNKSMNKESIIHCLVEQRGSLSHFYITSSKKQRNPFREKDYHSLSFITMSICKFASIKLRLEPFRRKSDKV